MALPFSPVTKTPAPEVAVSPDNPFAAPSSQQIHPPNFAHRVGDALLVAALAVLPDVYKGAELRQGSYIESEENIVYRAPLPGIGEVIMFQQREGGTIGYVFEDSGAALEATAEVGGEALML